MSEISFLEHRFSYINKHWTKNNILKKNVQADLKKLKPKVFAMSTMDFDTILQEAGGMGRFQWLNLALVLSNGLTVGWSMMQMAYAGIIPDWNCLSHENHTDPQSNHNLVINGSLNQCKVNISSTDGSAGLSTCQEYLFAEDKGLTIIKQWNLVCDLKWVKVTVSSIQMAGVMFGAIAAGQAGDWAGRKKTIYASAFGLSVVNIITGFSVSWQMFAVCRFFIGAFAGGFLVTNFAYSVELLPIKWRPAIAAFPLWGISISIFAVFAFLLENWSHLHLSCGFVGILPLLGYFYVPESVRWLAAKGRTREAVAVVKRIAKMNRKPVPAGTNDVLQEIADEEKKMLETGHKYTYLDLFKHLYTTNTTVSFSFMWCSITLIYYGVSFGVSSLAGNVYFNMFLLSMLDSPLLVASFFLVNKIGRKWSSVLYFSTSCFAAIGCLIAQIYAPDPHGGTIVTSLSLVTIAGLVSGWCVIMTWGTELYPTVVRNLGYGAQNTAARIGGMLGPFLINFDDMMVVSYVIICGLLVAIVILTLVTPETKGVALADSFNSGLRRQAKVQDPSICVVQNPPFLIREEEVELNGYTTIPLKEIEGCTENIYSGEADEKTLE